MHAIAHLIKERNSEARIAYVHSERFVSEMVRALQHNSMNEFKAAYRSLDALQTSEQRMTEDYSNLLRTLAG